MKTDNNAHITLVCILESSMVGENFEFTSLTWDKIYLSHPPWLEKDLNLFVLIGFKIYLNHPQWLEKILNLFGLNGFKYT